MAIAPTKDWHEVLLKKWLLWDSSAVIRIIQYEAEEIFDELKKIETTNVYIHPVQLELLATKVKADSLKRSAIMAEHLDLMPFTIKEIEMATKLQVAIGIKSQPSAADLYIGATLAGKNSDKFYMITHNIIDFPAPYFKKEGYVTLFSDIGVCSLAILSFDEMSMKKQR